MNYYCPIRKVALALLVCVPLVAGGCKTKQTSSKPIYSTRRNVKLEKMFDEEFWLHADVLNTAKTIINSASKYGTFCSSIQAQQYYDNLLLNSVVEWYFEDLYALGAATKKNGIDAKVSKEFEIYMNTTNDALANLPTNKKKLLSAQECSQFCDEIIKSSKYTTDNDIQEYYKSVEDFESQQKNEKSINQMAELIAFKTFTADRIIYKRIIEQYPIFEVQTHNGIAGPGYADFYKYFNIFFVKPTSRVYMQTDKPVLQINYDF